MPHHRLPEGTTLGWVPDFEPRADENAWHPLDLLMAPLHDGDGAFI